MHKKSTFEENNEKPLGFHKQSSSIVNSSQNVSQKKIKRLKKASPNPQPVVI